MLRLRTIKTKREESNMDEKQMICPLMTMGRNELEFCAEDKCAWWVKAIASACGHCIMQELGHLGDISDEIHNRTKGE